LKPTNAALRHYHTESPAVAKLQSDRIIAPTKQSQPTRNSKDVTSVPIPWINFTGPSQFMERKNYSEVRWKV